MENLIKQTAGIDCANDDFTVTFSVMESDFQVKHLATKTFLNNDEGFKNFAKWVEKLSDPSISLNFLMEATGVYHERLACYLFDSGKKVIVVLPHKAKHFSKTLKTKTVTDKESSKALAIMGLEKKLDLWAKPEGVFLVLKQLTREREQIQQHLTQLKNQQHAEQSGAWPNKNTLKRLNDHLTFLKQQKQAIEKDIAQILKENPELKRRIQKLTTIPGVGVLTAVTVLAETNGFNLIRNKRQLVSYAGYDVIQKDSGTSVHAKPRISKRGNRHIRKAMHMPALTSIRHCKQNQEVFKRIVTKSAIKMKGVVAVQRKLLVLIYTLWKNDSEYDPRYEIKKEIGQIALS